VRKTSKALGLLFAAVVCAAATTAQEKANLEQTVFGGEEPLKHAVSLSPAVLKVLLNTQAGRVGLQSAKDSERRHPERLFQAAEVHLGGPEETDLVVVGQAPMSGADNTWFWVVRPAHTRAQVVLFAGCNGIELMDSRTNGYRDIRGGWASPQEVVEIVYHFDGKKYKVWKRKVRPNT